MVHAPICQNGSGLLKMDLPVNRALAARYAALVSAGEITEDPAQLEAVYQLDLLNTKLGEVRLASKSSSLGWLFRRNKDL